MGANSRLRPLVCRGGAVCVPPRGAGPCAWREQVTYGPMLSYVVQLGGTVADDDPAGRGARPFTGEARDGGASKGHSAVAVGGEGSYHGA
jgi:hypothetical protein